MENRTKLLEIAYKYLEKTKKSSFNDIWKHVKKELNINEQEEQKTIGNLYTGMILNANFFLKSDKMWYLRSQVTLDEIKSQTNEISPRDIEDDFDAVEETVDITSTLDEEEEDYLDDEDEIYIAEDSYDDGDQELDVKLNNKIFNEEYQD